MQTSFSDQIALVTGAGGGLGRSYALELARLGARVVVNDLGVDTTDEEPPVVSARAVAAEIVAAGGQAFACDCSVTDEAGVADMIGRVLDQWGRIDILINNAGILQRRRFARSEMSDFRRIVDVNLMGSAICTKAVWNIMCDQGYGRILMTTSEGALYPMPGGASYAAAKLGLVGLMNALSVEGAPHGVRINSIAPAAATRMTEGLLNAADFARLSPDAVVAAALYLVSREAPNGVTLAAGAGRFERAYITHTLGVELVEDCPTPDAVAARFADISDRSGDEAPGAMHSVARVGRA